jgi:ABC-2 type transport system ATP-binding protein
MVPIEITNLWKSFGAVQAVRDLSFRVEPGRVTGFLGPNGAGKSTTLRILLGLIHPLRGDATIDGVHYDKLDDPSGRVGAMLEDTSFHPGRSGENHLRVLATAGGHSQSRVDELIDLVSLRGAEKRRVGQYSQGMRQRLALASAMIGDPGVLILDEPTNGLDPGGIRWLRGLMRRLADEGRTVLVSSHLLAEVAQAVDDVVIIARGELRAKGTLEEVLGGGNGAAVTDVRSPYPDHLRDGLTRRGLAVERGHGDNDLVVRAEPEVVGIAAAEDGLTLYRLTPRTRSLEDTFFELTADEGPRT